MTKKDDVSDFLCAACRAHLRTLTPGRTLVCPHNGATLTLDWQGQRTVTFANGKGPTFTTELKHEQ